MGISISLEERPSIARFFIPKVAFLCKTTLSHTNITLAHRKTILEGLASQIISTYLEIEAKTFVLKDNIRSLHHLGAYTLGLNDKAWRAGCTVSDQNHHFWASEILSCLDHRHDGDGRDTWQMAGLLVVPETVLDCARELNALKSAFQDLIHAYRQQQNTPSSNQTMHRLFQEKSLLHHLGTGAATRQVIARLGASRVHLRHCTRHIVCLDKYPSFVSLSWVRQRRSIQKVSLDQCIQKLERLNRDSESQHISLQIEALARLPVHQQHLLRQVQTVKYPSIKTKVYWEDGSDNHLGYLSMPALIPAGNHEQLPPMTNLAPEPPPARAQRRSDNRLPEEPLCPSIRVFLAYPEATPDTKELA